MDSDQAKKTEKKQKSPRSEIVELHPKKPDITGPKQVEESLEQSRKEWESTFNAMSDWVILTDLESRILRTNSAGQEFTGKSPAEIPGQSLCKLVHGSEKHIAGCPMLKMLQTNKRESAELQVPGTEKWLMVTVDPITDEEGKLTGAVHIARDITDRKKAENAVRDSEERYRNIYEQSPVGIGLSTLDGKVVRANKTMEVITGYFEEELKKIDLAETFENPQDRKKLLETIERYGHVVDFPIRMKRKDGAVYDALLNVSRVKVDGQEMVQTICMDVTERKKAEEVIRRSERELKIRNRIKTIFLTKPDDQMYAEVLQVILEVMNSKYGTFGYFNEHGAFVVPAMTREIYWNKCNVPEKEIIFERGQFSGIWGDAIKEKKTLWRNEGAFRTPPGHIPIENTMVTPIIYRGKIISAIHIANKPGGYDEKDRALLEEIGEHIAPILHARLERDKEEKDRERAEEELKRSKEFLDNTMNALDDPVFVKDEQHRWVALNDAACEAMGHTREELVGKSDYDLSPKEEADVFWKQDDHVLETGETNLNEEEITWHGKLHTISTKKSVFTDSLTGNKYIAGTIRDITERKRAEEAYRTLVDYSLQGLAIFQDGRVVFANEAMGEISGYTPEEMLALSPEEVEAFVHPEDRELLWSRHRARLNGENPPEQYEFRGIRKDGTICWLEIHASRIEYQGKPAIQAAYVDITERKRAKEAVRESEEKYRSIYNTAASLIVSVDTSGVIRDCNARIMDILGYEKDEIIGQSIAKIIHPDYMEKAQGCLNEILVKGVAHNKEYKMVRKDNQIIDVEVNAAGIKEGEGKFVGGVCIIENITERKRAEEAYRSLVDHSLQGLAIFQDGCVVFANEAMAEIIGYTVEEMMAVSSEEVQMFVYPEDRGLVWSRHRDRLKGEKPPEQYEFRGIRKNGSVCWLEIHASRIEYQGKPAIQAAYMDITERKRAEDALRQSEERFRNLYENALVGLYRTTPDGRILMSNPALLRMLGYSSLEELAGRNLEEAGFEVGYPRSVFKEQIEKEGQVVGLESTWTRRDGTSVYVRESAKAIRDEQGNTLYYEGTVEDITERKHAEDALVESQKRLELFFSQSLDGFFFMMLDEPIRWDDTADKEKVLDYVFAHQRMTKVNDAMLIQYGATREQFVGLTPNDLYTHNVAHGREVWRRFFDAGQLHVETDERKVNGTPIWIEGDYICLYDNEGRITGHFGIQREVTRQKRTREALKESEEKYREIVELAPDGIVTVDLKGIITSCNNAFLKQTGYSREDFVGRHISKIPTARLKDVPKYLKLFGSMLRGIVPKPFVFKWVHKDGTEYWGDVCVSIIKRNGKTIGFQAFTRDITERKQAEEALRESQENYRMVSGLTSDYIMKIKVKPNGQLVLESATDRLENNTGYAIDELRRQSSWSKIVHPDDYDKFQDFLKRILSSRKSCELEFRGIDRKQEFEWLHAYGLPILDEKNDRVISIVFAAKDITERKLAEEELRESEEKYRQLVSTTTDAVMLFDAETRNILDVNKACEELYGYSREEFLNLRQNDITAEPEKSEETIQKTVNGELKRIPVRYHKKKDGTVFPVEISGSMFELKGRKVLCGVIRDITERKKAEMELKLHSKIMTNMSEGVHLVRADDGIITYTNPKFEELFGYDKGEMIGKHVSIVNAPADKHPEETAREIIEIMNKEGAWEGEIENTKKDGTRFWCFASVTMFDHPEYGRVLVAAHTDITERKKAEIKLKNSEARLSEAESIAHIGYLDLDLSTNKIVWSPETYRLYGLNPKDFEPTLENTVKLVHPDDLEFVQKNLDMAMKGEKEYDIEHRNIRADGKVVQFHARARLIRDQHGKPIRLIGTVNDITARKKAEEAVRESGEHYRMLAETMNDGLSQMDEKGRLIYVNDKHCEMHGRTQDEMIGKHWTEFYDEEAQKIIKEQLAKRREGISEPYEISTLRKNGERIAIRISPKAIFDEAGKFRGSFAIMSDVTEQKKAAEQIENLAKFPAENPYPVLRIVRDGTVLFANDASSVALETWGIEVGERLPKAFSERVEEVLSLGKVSVFELECLNGQIFEMAMAPVAESGYVNVYGLDITERKRSEKKIIEYDARLRSVASELSLAEERERRHIASGLHDDIIQPLAFLGIKLDLQKKAAKESSSIESFNEMQTTINNLISTARTLTFDLSSPVLYELGFEAAIQEWLTTNIEQKHGIATVFEDDGQSKPLSNDMRGSLFKVVKELLVNVVKHAEASSVKISVVKEDDKIKICVEDNGAGFDSVKKMAKLSESSGYGLFSIRERLDYFGGSFEIESERDHGTRVTLVAPLKHED